MTFRIEIIDSVSEIAPDAWDKLTCNDIFASHAFLKALEVSQSTGAGAGWQSVHLVAYEDSTPVGIMPLWIKSHSYGEYVFDHAFADAYERSGMNYYPKLLSAAPFTPVNGARVFSNNDDVKMQLLAASVNVAEQNGFSSVHVNFSTDCIDDSWLERHNIQYHFYNRKYASFDDFLNQLSSSKRKNIRKERAKSAASGLNIETKLGNEITEDDWECFWKCYQDTGARKWGTPYLTRDFFDEISNTMAKKIVMFIAYEGETPIACALNFRDETRLIGRYWGCLCEYKFLHLELCYYQAIDFAINHHIPLIEAGAQGEHKIARGYEPVITKSYHKFIHPEFHNVIDRYIRQERSGIAEYVKDVAAHLPYKKETI